MRRALLALAAIALLGTGVVLLTTSVPVLTVSGGTNGFIAYTPDSDKVVYSYRQSIYHVTVCEEFERAGDRLRLMRVRAETSARGSVRSSSGASPNNAEKPSRGAAGLASQAERKPVDSSKRSWITSSVVYRR